MFQFLLQKFTGSLSTTAPPQVQEFTDPSQLKKQLLDLVKNWPSDLLDVIELSPEDSIILSPLKDRWLWPVISPRASRDSIVLTGDAWHPMDSQSRTRCLLCSRGCRCLV
ncbi:hypothetical protein Ancab_033264 [Ancistrocladus abbreviatus]